MASDENLDAGIPDNITYFDFGVFAVATLKSGKLLLIVKQTTDSGKSTRGAHLTFHPGTTSGVIDAHLTDPTAAEPHRTLFAIPKDRLPELLALALPRVDGAIRAILRRAFRRVRPGWLEHRGIVVFPLWPQGSAALAKIGRQKGRKWVLDQEKLESHLGDPLDGRDLHEAEDGPFLLLWRGRRGALAGGVLFKKTDRNGQTHFCWCKASDVMSELQRAWKQVEPIVKPYLIDPEELRQIITDEGALEARRKRREVPEVPGGTDASSAGD